MPLWGTSDSDESKPKNLTTAEKKEVYATNSGWVRELDLSYQVMVIQMLILKFYVA